MDTDVLLDQAIRGNSNSLEELLIRFRPRLTRMIELRMDSRLKRRLDPSDVIQEAYLQVAAKLAGFRANPRLPFFLWLRMIVSETLIDLYRHHFQVQSRDPRREEMDLDRPSAGNSATIAAYLLGTLSTPSIHAQRAEQEAQVQAVIDGLDTEDREIITLRHGEQLTRLETSLVLGISESAAAKRYLRALARLKSALASKGEFI
jgi:RNA polymerase sigma-70 factor (ECF subfamily)